MAEQTTRSLRDRLEDVLDAYGPATLVDAVLAVLADAGSPITPARLAEIAQRTDAATAGPWTVDGLLVEATEGTIADLNWPVEAEDEYQATVADATFIAHARTDLPELLAAYREVDAHRCIQADRIRHLREILANAISRTEALTPAVSQIRRERDTLREQIRDAHHDLQMAVGDEFTTVNSAAVEAARRIAELTQERDEARAHATEMGRRLHDALAAAAPALDETGGER